MLGRSKLTVFVATTNAENARMFYETRLGLTFLHDDGYALVLDEGDATMVQAQAGVTG